MFEVFLTKLLSSLEWRIIRLRNKLDRGVERASDLDFESVFSSMADWICEASYNKLNETVELQVKRTILDGIASYLIGFNSYESQALLKNLSGNGFFDALDSKSSDSNLILSHVVYAVASACQIHDVNDGHPSAGLRGGSYHPGRVIIPTSLVLASQLGLSGKELVVMVALGYDVALKSMNGPKNSPSDAYGVAALSSYALGLTHEETCFALKIAGFNAPKSGSEDFEVNNLTIAQQARAGLEAALLTKNGYPLSKSCTLSGERFLFSKPRRLGGDSLGLYFKPYPSCRSTHKFIEAAKLLRDKVIGNLHAISEVYIYHTGEDSGPAHSVGPDQYYKSYEFSISYCVVVTLIYGDFGIEHLDPDITNNELVQKIQTAICCVLVDEDDDLSGTLDIRFKNGEQLSEKAINIWGSPENPLTDEDIALKLNRFTPLSSNDAYELLDLVSGVPAFVDTQQLVSKIIDLEKRIYDRITDLN